jgi:hypothetical protein
MDIKCAIVRADRKSRYRLFYVVFFQSSTNFIRRDGRAVQGGRLKRKLTHICRFLLGQPSWVRIPLSSVSFFFFAFVSKYTRNKVRFYSRFYSVTLYQNLQNKMGSEKILRFPELVIHDTLYISYSMHSSILFPQHRSKPSLLPHVQDSE